MAVTWIGYNVQTDVETICQIDNGTGGVGGTFTSNSKPFTDTAVARLNLQTYNYINAALRLKGITVPITDVDDIATLSIINTYLTAEIIENVRWKVLENVNSSPGALKWGNAGRALLRDFINGRSFLSDNTTQGAYTGLLGLADKEIAEEDPIFDLDYKW